MEILVSQWNALTASKKMVAVLGLVTILTCLTMLVRLATQPSMALLYSGLEASQAGDLVRALEQRSEAYEIKGGAIFVPFNRRDELRLTLASEGLPANGASGYELLDSLSGFGTTSQMFDAAYLRAKEGELARTITSSNQISMARVHIAQSKSSAFNRDKTGSASVFVSPTSGKIDASQAKALRFLVASAVAGISPENVSIVDERGNLIGDHPAETSGAPSDAQAADLKQKVMRILEARVGADNAIVEISVETDLQSEQITERVFDPAGRVIISTDNEERSNTAEGSGNRGITVASNLPDGEAATTDNSKSNGTETRERINYEVSETQREIIKNPGAIKRLSVAVLVNGAENDAAPGGVEQRSDQELEQFTQLVKSAVGFDETRGDVITVQSMVFSPKAPLGTGPVSQPLFNMALDLMTLLQMLILGIVGVIVALLVIRPILKGAPENALPILQAPQVLSDVPAQADAITGEIDFEQEPEGLVTIYDKGIGEQGDRNIEAGRELGVENPIARLREMIETRQEETVDILRQWLEQKEQAKS